METKVSYKYAPNPTLELLRQTERTINDSLEWIISLKKFSAEQPPAAGSQYCSSPPGVENGAVTLGSRGILGYPVGTFAYYQCDSAFKSKDNVELYRSCEFNGERAVWSDASSECVLAPAGVKEKRFGTARISVGADQVKSPTDAEAAKVEGDQRKPSLEFPYNEVVEMKPTAVVYSPFEDEDEDEDDDDDVEIPSRDIDHHVGPYSLRFKNVVPPWLPAPRPSSATQQLILQMNGASYAVDIDSGTGTQIVAPGERRGPQIRFRPVYAQDSDKGDHDDDASEDSSSSRLRVGEAPSTGYALYPAVPFAEHQVTAFARFREPSRVQSDIRDNGPTWNIPTGPHYAPSAPNERTRKLRIQLRPNVYLPPGETPPQYLPQSAPQNLQGFGLDYPGWSPFRPKPDPVLSRYAYGCGPAPVIPFTRMSRPPQTRYSIGSVIKYFCASGKTEVSNTPMQTMCVYDDGQARWTSVEGRCTDDFDVEFPEDAERDAHENKKLQGWRMSREQRPGYVMVEKEISVPPFPDAETYNPPTRVSFAEPAPGVLDAKPSRIASLPWPLNLLASDESKKAEESRQLSDANPEEDRVVVSKTIFLQPPPFPNPPWRYSRPAGPLNTKQRMCAFLDDPPPPPKSCRKPPSLAEIALKTLFKDPGVVPPRDVIDFDSVANNEGNIGGKCVGAPPLVNHARLSTPPKPVYPFGAQAEYICEPGFAYENGVAVRTSCYVPIGSREGVWNPVMEEADFPFPRNHYGGVKNPEQIERPAIVPQHNGIRRVNENLISNWKDDVESTEQQQQQNDQRNCVGDECIGEPGPDELESSGVQSFNYEVPQGMVKNGKVALNIFHGNDRRNFAGEGVIRSMGDTGFPFNEMYKQQQKGQNTPSHDKPRTNSGSRAFALSERLMRGGIRGNREEPVTEPAYITGLVFGITSAAILAIALCKCISSCRSMRMVDFSLAQFGTFQHSALLVWLTGKKETPGKFIKRCVIYISGYPVSVDSVRTMSALMKVVPDRQRPWMEWTVVYHQLVDGRKANSSFLSTVMVAKVFRNFYSTQSFLQPFKISDFHKIFLFDGTNSRLGIFLAKTTLTKSSHNLELMQV
ncbi:unnamed protein product [Notodromas monacha]|uniref:Interleukin-2 receptor subunit alpha n=1 Tax=Notodromas monacha TaxID=399045 RepID=A0A7R9GBM0_9CRUS|nr:unnamed protein product [Notodromas monacha]CAG0916517.1 unnamed protein product [Notodromas monacha]